MKTQLSILLGFFCLLFVNLASAQTSSTRYVELLVANDPAMKVEVEPLDAVINLKMVRDKVRSLEVTIGGQPTAFNPLATAGTHDIASGGEFESRDGTMKISFFEATEAEKREAGISQSSEVVIKMVIYKH